MEQKQTPSKFLKAVILLSIFSVIILVSFVLTLKPGINVSLYFANRLKVAEVKIDLQKKKKEMEQKKTLFYDLITKEERNAFRNAMRAFSMTVPSNVTYMLYGGTLLGSYRHHGMIPWDDDLDLLVKEGDKQVLKKSLDSLKPEFELNTRISKSWKFFHRTSIMTRLKWKWPFLDIFFYKENATHIWDSHSAWSRYKYLKSNVFPLTTRLFMSMMLPAPWNTEAVLRQQYDMEVCKTNDFDHKREKSRRHSFIVTLPCEGLRDMFPFVRRKQFLNQTIEILEEATNYSVNNTKAINSTFISTKSP